MFGKVKFILCLLFVVLVADSKKLRNRIRNRGLADCRKPGERCGVFWAYCCSFDGATRKYYDCDSSFIGKCVEVRYPPSVFR